MIDAKNFHTFFNPISILLLGRQTNLFPTQTRNSIALEKIQAPGFAKTSVYKV